MQDNFIWQALDLIGSKGKWTKHKFRSPKGARHCMFGALDEVIPNGAAIGNSVDLVFPNEVAVLAATISEHHPQFAMPGDEPHLTITLFNDADSTTYDDVHTVMEKAAIKYDEIV